MLKKAIEVGKTYNTAGGSKITIASAIDPKEDWLASEAGYAFRSSCGRNYTAYGDHNYSEMCLVSEHVPKPPHPLQKVRRGFYSTLYFPTNKVR